ncbi:MAG: hypothetical protein Q7J35_18585 [Candidatus Methanoperedens sp.]|nr:hypothetical protein [Candidatus Methanoperedens sp.]
MKEKMCLIYGEDNKKCFYEEPVTGLLWPEILIWVLTHSDVKTIAIDTDRSSLDKVQANCKILIDEHSTQKLDEELKDVELLFVTLCMGNNIFTEALSIITEISKKQDTLVIGLMTIPSEKYAENQTPAMEDLIEISKKFNTVAFVDLDRVHIVFPALPIDQISSFSGKHIADMIGGIVDCLNPEILWFIKLDFNELKNIMKNGEIGTLVFNEVEGEREKDRRSQRLAHDLMQRSFMDIDANTSKNCLLIFRQGVDSCGPEMEGAVTDATYYFDINANILWGSMETKDYYGKLRCMGIISGFNLHG